MFLTYQASNFNNWEKMINFIVFIILNGKFSLKLNFIRGWNSIRFIPGRNSRVNRIFFIPGRVSSRDEISSHLNVNALKEGVYTRNFIPGWNLSRDEIILVYGEMCLTVYTFLPRWNFILEWTHPCQGAFTCNRDEISFDVRSNGLNPLLLTHLAWTHYF